MRTKRVEESADITIDTMMSHQTYNDCPQCGRTWETIPAIKGVVHRTQLCERCKSAIGESVHKRRS